MSTNDRTYDVVVWGATGFTGRLVAEYLAREHGVGRTLRWAMGGRSREKLEAVRDALAHELPAARDVPLVVADARDPASLAPLVRSTKVIATTVGPYAVHGKELVAACVDHGTDYCDLTGETQFVREMIDLHHARARDVGAKIVHCCGFDSIPSDLGVLMMHEAARARGTRCREVKMYVVALRGGTSGGTIASALNLVEQATKDKRVRRIVGDPYALVPEHEGRGPDGPDQRGVRYDADLGRWTGPFVMAAINTRVVRRSNALLGYPYGKDFRYAEVTSTGAGPKGWLVASAMSAGLGAFAGVATIGPLRELLAKKVLPKPGEGPSKEKRENGFFKLKLVAHLEDGGKLVGHVEGRRDPGYGGTAIMLAESAVCLAHDPLEARGGVLTPASAMGKHLLERLRRAGMTYEVDAADAPRASASEQHAHP